jgi:predicted NBD/HSP70 family sugar kinase
VQQEAGARASSVRRGNVQRVLEALRLSGPSSQAALARRTDLSAATVNSIVKDLRSKGLAELLPVNGRESLVSLVAGRGVVLTLQVKVTALRAALFDFGAGTRFDAELELPSGPSQEGGDLGLALSLARAVIGEAGLRPQDVKGVAAAVQAPVSKASGTIASWARLQLPAWKDVPVAPALEAGLGVPAIAENDANLAALAEWTWGAGQGTEQFIYAMCSEHIGGGIVIGGRIYRGGDGLAGELGHVVLDQDGPLCFCGSRGCLTTFASERSILQALDGAPLPPRNLKDVVERARRGDPACRRVLSETGRRLGQACASSAKLMAPDVIAVGGTLGEAGPLVFDSVLSSIEVQSLRAVSPGVRFLQARLGADAAALGGVAAVLAETAEGVSTLPEWTRRPHIIQVVNSRSSHR